MLLVAMAAILMLGACGTDDDENPLADLQVVGVDFELNSIILTNNGPDDVRTQGLWIYQNGESSRFNIFTIEPRATILFSVRDLGEVTQSGGEIALYTEESFSDPGAMIDYVAWGTSGHSRVDVATEAELWGLDESVETEEDTVILTRTEASSIGATAWTASSEVGG